MRYIFAGFLLCAVAIVSIAGFRGSMSRRPPIELFPDMVRQQKVRPQTESEFFGNGFESREPVPGTVARNSPYEDIPLNTGRVTGTTNFVDLNPLPITAQVMARGRERFQITCLPCHGAQGDGKGVTTKYGMTVIATLHDPRIVCMTDGEIFNTITNGKNQMQGYGMNVAISDRWAIIAYVRALQLSHLGSTEDVPADHRAALKK